MVQRGGPKEDGARRIGEGGRASASAHVASRRGRLSRSIVSGMAKERHGNVKVKDKRRLTDGRSEIELEK